MMQYSNNFLSGTDSQGEDRIQKLQKLQSEV